MRAAILLLLLLSMRATAAPPDAGPAFFESNIRPVLVRSCYPCHSADAKKLRGDLRLDSRTELRRVAESGLLLKVLRYDGEIKMPPKERLPAKFLADFEKWVKMGAPDPRGEASTVAVRPVNIAEGKKFWSFQPLRPVAVPDIRAATSPIDAFILQRLEKAGLKPAPAAERRTLLRRATFDLIGLPPTPEEIEAFVNDPAPDAFARVVERLLASPAYGERWGRHWLDVVRYADTAGETADYPVPQAHRYRDYVIDSFNRDKPHDEFVREQLAGDLLAQSGPKERARERMIATGFLAISRRFGFDPENYHHLTIQDTIDTVGQAFLGLSLGCARCHDHKFDPIAGADYYALYGIFASTRYSFPGSEEKHKPYDMVPLGGNETAYAVMEGKPQNARVHRRGEPRDLGPEMPRRYLDVFGGEKMPATERGSGRLHLAKWITETSAPLLARVMVNRIWEHHFGVGLVATENDFGARGARPTHPELLDWLALRFVSSGWSMKEMHRLILLSSTYQQASTGTARQREVDPDNALLFHFPRRRLDAESLRDAMLMLGGKLDLTPGGPHPFPPVEKWGYTQHTPFSAVYETNKRSVYLMTQRLKRHPFLALFDGPDPNASTPRRSPTTVPTQTLFLMNSPFVHEQADGLAGRLLKDKSTTRERINFACTLALGRTTVPEEMESSERFIERYRATLEALKTPADRIDRLTWAAFARTLLTRNEFLFVE
jgi:hypothetical protein